MSKAYLNKSKQPNLINKTYLEVIIIFNNNNLA